MSGIVAGYGNPKITDIKKMNLINRKDCLFLSIKNIKIDTVGPWDKAQNVYLNIS